MKIDRLKLITLIFLAPFGILFTVAREWSPDEESLKHTLEGLFVIGMLIVGGYQGYQRWRLGQEGD